MAGRLFDKDGNVKEWWSSVDVERFIERAQCFVEQYSNYTVPEVNMNVSTFHYATVFEPSHFTCGCHLPKSLRLFLIHWS